MKPQANRIVVPSLLFAAIVVVGLNAWFAFRSVESLLRSEYWVEHTWQVIAQVERIMGSAKDAETGSRGFLITGDDQYLEPYFSARRDLPAELDTFQSLTADNSSQQARIVEMRAIVEQRLSLVEQGIDLRRNGDSTDIHALIVTGTGKVQMDHLRSIADDMQAEERRLLIIRTATAQSSGRRARYTVSVASGLDLLLIMLMFRYFARERTLRVAEVALHASEARFHRLVEAMPLGLLISDISGRILYANRAIEHLLGYSDEEIASGTLTFGYLCPGLTAADNAFTDGTAAKVPFESVCKTNSGATIEVLIGVAVLNPEAGQESRQFAAFIADLSLQKKSEEVIRRTEKLAIAGRFAASIAHEINNPLEAITNCLYLAAQTDLPADSRSYLTLAQSELDRVTQITVQTLRFYRGSTRPTETDMHELIETVLTLLEPRTAHTHIEIIRRFRADSTIIVQDGEIRQVMVNLIGNALDALPSGGRIHLRTAPAHNWRTGAQGIVITVADNGSGMDKETQPHIFEPFFSTKGLTGTGLGLWISHEIVAKHHGSILVRTRQTTPERPGGTTFRLFIPSQPHDPAKA